jgi:hypothetical protein
MVAVCTAKIAAHACIKVDSRKESNHAAKGSTAPDGTYTYTCGCGFEIPTCPYCYGGDLDKCRAAIKTARGQIYYGLLKTILSHVGKQIVDEIKRLRQRQGGIAPVDIGYVSLKFGLNYKATCEWLEETGCIRPGTHERITEMRDYSVRFIYEKAREKFPELNSSKKD